MPLVRISVQAGRSTDELRRIGDAIHRALVEAIQAPADGRFQIFTEHAPGGLVFPPEYRGSRYTQGIVIVQLTMNAGRTVEMKKALYSRMAELLEKEAGVRREDVIVSLVEVPKENWSWGKGEATYVP
jgi:phenylpyruvate tautomerase PptA (4-oxalocrotonate tautomerase family)